jgi:hypothetical protein
MMRRANFFDGQVRPGYLNGLARMTLVARNLKHWRIANPVSLKAMPAGLRLR